MCLSILYLGLHYVCKGASEFAKAIDICSTLGTGGTELHSACTGKGNLLRYGKAAEKWPGEAETQIATLHNSQIFLQQHIAQCSSVSLIPRVLHMSTALANLGAPLET